VLTHGFTMAEDGRKMSKSLGNIVVAAGRHQAVGADILRLWVATTDYWEDQRSARRSSRPMSTPTASCATPSAGCSARSRIDDGEDVPLKDMPELERLMLHRLSELDEVVREAYDAFDYKRIFARCSTS
jgi:isoleucyl-tRNA synthetase